MSEATLSPPGLVRVRPPGKAVPHGFRYAFAVVAVVLAWLVRSALDPVLGNLQAFPTFYVAVAITSWWAGWRPALVTLVLGYLAADWFFLPPRYSLWVHDWAHLVELATYFSVSGIIVLLMSSLRRAERRADASARIALKEKVDLELEVQERRRVEAALRESEQRFRAIFDEAPIAIALHDLQGRFFQVNHVAAAFFGRTPEEMRGLAIREVVHPDDWHLTAELLPRLLAGAIPRYMVERRYTRKDGTVLWGRADVSLVRDAAGKPAYVIGALVDITEKKRAEEVLARNHEELERLVKERTARLLETVEDLEHFSYSITHDMRAPLRAMQSYATLIERQCGGCSQTRSIEFFHRIKVASDRMDKLITDSLNYTKILRQELPLGRVDLARLLRGLLEGYPNLQPDKAEIRIEGILPPVLGNEAGLTHCLSNLLGNAVKFVAPGVKPRVRIWAETLNQSVRLWIQDNGIGIPEYAHERIFGMFQRLHSEDDYPGTGIGLTIAQKALRRMGGQIGLESEVGKGSRFWIELPAAPAQKENIQPRLSHQERA